MNSIKKFRLLVNKAWSLIILLIKTKCLIDVQSGSNCGKLSQCQSLIEVQEVENSFFPMEETEPCFFQQYSVPGQEATGTNWNAGISLWTSGSTSLLWEWWNTDNLKHSMILWLKCQLEHQPSPLLPNPYQFQWKEQEEKAWMGNYGPCI